MGEEDRYEVRHGGTQTESVHRNVERKRQWKKKMTGKRGGKNKKI
jgi:hypothetical protein